MYLVIAKLKHIYDELIESNYLSYILKRFVSQTYLLYITFNVLYCPLFSGCSM